MPKLWFMGEALIDFVPVPAPDGGLAYAPRCGGSPFNAAKAAAILGAEAGFLGAISTDLFGEMLEADLARHGIDTTQAPRLSAPTTLAFVDLQRGEPRYAFFNEGTATRMIAPDPARFQPGRGDVIGFGSISLIDLPGADAITDFAEAVAGRAIVAIDPNARPGMTPDLDRWRRRIGRLLDVADIVRVSVEDLAALAPGQGPAEFARGRIAAGASLVVVTYGADGADAWTATSHVTVPGHRVVVVDTVGAGDTLMGTLLARLAAGGYTAGDALRHLDGKTVSAVLKTAVAASALNCMASGCAPPGVAAVAAFQEQQAAI